MGLTDFFDSVMGYLNLSEEAHADAPEKDDEEDSKDEGDDGKEEKEGGDEEQEGGDEDKEEGSDDEKEEGGDDEEEEEEDDEPVDPKPALEEECANSAQCRGYKHHFDECVERVTAHHENPEKGHKEENCVEEFFHLQHCATACAAPKLFKQLK